MIFNTGAEVKQTLQQLLNELSMALKDPGATINCMKHNEQLATDQKYPKKILLYVMLCAILYHLYN